MHSRVLNLRLDTRVKVASNFVAQIHKGIGTHFSKVSFQVNSRNVYITLNQLVQVHYSQ